MQHSGASNTRIELHSIQAIESDAVIGDKLWPHFAVQNICNLLQRYLLRRGAMRYVYCEPALNHYVAT